MRLNCNGSRFLGENVFVALRSELKDLIAVTEALDKSAPKGASLKDEVIFEKGGFRFDWVTKDGTNFDDEGRKAIEVTIERDLAQVQERRRDANDRNVAIPELSTDSKAVSLNKALSDATSRKLELVSGTDDSTPIPHVDPRKMVLRHPTPEPRDLHVDLVITGSNVVGGDFQLKLFRDSIVDVVYFVRGGPVSEIRARVPIHLANVENLVTRIRANCTRSRPEDSFAVAKEFPTLYRDESVQEASNPEMEAHEAV